MHQQIHERVAVRAVHGAVDESGPSKGGSSERVDRQVEIGILPDLSPFLGGAERVAHPVDLRVDDEATDQVEKLFVG